MWGRALLVVTLVVPCAFACDALFGLPQASDGGTDAIPDACAGDCGVCADGACSTRLASGLPNVITLVVDQNEVFYARTTSVYFAGDGVVYGNGAGTEVGFIRDDGDGGVVMPCGTAANAGLANESTLVPSGFFVTDTAVYQFAQSRECCKPPPPNPNTSPSAGLCVTIVAHDRWDAAAVGTDNCRPSEGSVCQVTVTPLLVKDPSSTAFFYSRPNPLPSPTKERLCSGANSTLTKDVGALGGACSTVDYLTGFAWDQFTPTRVLANDAGAYVIGDYFPNYYTDYDNTSACLTPSVTQHVVLPLALDAGPNDFIYSSLSPSLCDYVLDGDRLLSCESFYEVETQRWYLQVVSRSLTSGPTTLLRSSPILTVGASGSVEPLTSHLTADSLYYVDPSNVIWRLPFGDGPAQSLARADDRVTAITSDARYVYWAEVAGGVFRAALP